MAIINWASRAVLAWRLSNTMDVSFVWLRSRRLVAECGRGPRFSTPTKARGSHRPPSPARSPKQASRSLWTAAAAGWTTSSSNGCRGQLKYEDVYLKGYADGREAARGIAAWIAFCDDRRPHQALAGRTPMAVWREAIAGAGAVDMMDNASALPTCPQQREADAVSRCVIEGILERSRSN